MAKRVGVVLSGCGFLDGAEIHEAVITLLALDRAGAEAVCLAPGMDQKDVVDHLDGSPAKGEKRSVLRESARIARGKVKDLRKAKAAELDAVILPGGYGAAKNLSTFATEGEKCSIQEDCARLLREMHAARKPIGAICIAPAVVARAFAGTAVHPTITVGTDEGTSRALGALGARPVDAQVTEAVVDRENRIVTTPAYMLAERISEAATGIEKLVAEVLALTK